MPDLASEKAGGKVFMVSSLDPAHPGDNIIDGNDSTFWISTGLYPQEILLELGQSAKVSSVSLSSTRVRSILIEGWGQEDTQANCQMLAEGELANTANGRLQKQEMQCRNQEIEFLRLVILSGWDDFCTVHHIHVDGQGVAPGRDVRVFKNSKSATFTKDGHSHAAGANAKRRQSEHHHGGIDYGLGMLEVSIPEHKLQEKSEPDAPRMPDNTRTWGSAGPPVQMSRKPTRDLSGASGDPNAR
mmetsp:Transcript_21149/g.59474  ORF Transcript_21149/g.59474 Transcript_21149/m.59474 type:complete len:243 (+) Transcript_21149:124-852(+)